MLTRLSVGAAMLELVRGDITSQRTDAIVNAANTTLLGGGGVDGAIHRAGGPAILDECRSLGGCETGDAKATGGGRLPAKWVIHAVGPVYGRDEARAAALLESAYRRSVEVAIDLGARSVAFPSISTGAYRYPVVDAAEIALRVGVETLRATPPPLDLIRWVLFSEADLLAYAGVLATFG